MKSSFVKQYQVTQQSDGSAEVVVKGSRAGAFGAASNPVGLTVVLLITYVVVWIALVFLGEYLSIGFIENHMGKAALVALAGPLLLLKFVFGGRKYRIRLHPEGVQFARGKKQLARSDIKKFAVVTESVSGSANGYVQTAYVCADALGQQIKLTGHMKKELAEAVRGEIVSYYKGK
ncbi:hypothetical protein [Ralstonia solanacearum]|uniref:hypothetical protein n=1 Tax=Ralstonia solanacearum TaxID=305 RepID=UPI00202A2A05|nr:hypothetical protein [Ralstonia solanacearum]MCL9844613.1 hypothetical protein [Ralstonia solanacearum]MDC6253168.1 hypothetical protein [Ralstonia solanacearum]MDC6257750.1 hypothetical protein [Ralstonia solanacearum]MDC6301594.1 hypothetical protein [Ralstonia solanacearum]